MENVGFNGTTVCQMLSSFLQVSVPYEVKMSGSGQSGFTDFEYDISGT